MSFNPETLPSPGYLEDIDCQGLDFTKSSKDELTFGQCLDKFGDKYTIPNNTINSFINNLQYSFSELSDEDKKNHLDKLQSFINKNTTENFDTKENLGTKENFNKSWIILIGILIILLVNAIVWYFLKR